MLIGVVLTHDKKSISGCVVYLAGIPIAWKVKKQQCVALSTMEAEYIAISQVVKEIVWLDKCIRGCSCFGIEFQKPVILSDSQSAIFLPIMSLKNRQVVTLIPVTVLLKIFWKRNYFIYHISQEMIT